MVIKILLLLLSALFLSQCAQYHIDLDQCDKTTNCFIRESCIDQNTNKANLVHYRSSTPRKAYCDVVIQIRPYSSKKYHIMMQVNTTGAVETIAKSGVSLKQDDVQFACMEAGPKVKDELFNFVEMGDQLYEDKLVFCSFTMETKMGERISDNFATNANYPTVEFTQGSLISIVFEREEATFWIQNPFMPLCDPEKMTSSDSFVHPLLQEKIDIYQFPPIKCEQEKLFLTITRENAQPVVLAKGASLVCDNDEWTYQESSIPSKIPEIENFQVACTAKYCNLCDPLDRMTCTVGCTPYTEDETADCMNANCPDNQWMINGGSVMKGEIACKQEIGALSSKKSYWYLNADSDPVEVEKAACFDKSICWTTQKLLLCPDKPTWECHAYNKTSDLTELFCPPGFSLTWDNAGKTGQPSKITCDFSTGYYKDEDNNVQMKFGYSVFCAGKLIDKPQSGASQGNMGAIVGGVGGAFILLAVVGAVVIFLVRRRAATPEDAAKTVTGTEQSAVAQKTHEP